MDVLSALIGGLLGGTVAAVLGGLITLTAQKREHDARSSEAATAREHERAMARDRRLQDRRATAYERILVHTFRLNTWAQRTEPLLGPLPDPPPPLPDEDVWKLNALTAAHASSEVQAIVRTMTETAKEFELATFMLREQNAGRLTGKEEAQPRVQLSEARARLYDQTRQLGDRIAAELRGDV